MSFGSDNQSGASDKVIDALSRAFTEVSEAAYGDDQYCAEAAQRLSDVFETPVSAFFVTSGTAANMLALSALVDPWDGILCHHQAHILLDESSGPAMLSGGAALMPAPTKALKLTPDVLSAMLARLPSERPHNIRARALSVSQASECGQVYSTDELSALCEVARSAGLAVHMDGARFANAVAYLDCSPADITWRAGVDVLCLGATKNGAVAAEAIVFFKQELARDFDYRLKRSGHLLSKGRLFGAQFLAWLENDHWLHLARHANQTAETLRDSLPHCPGIRLAFPCASNETFVIVKKALLDALNAQGISAFDWYPDALPPDCRLKDDETLARLVTSFATKNAEIERFQAACTAWSEAAIVDAHGRG